jgi:hypothetical protein
MPATGLSALNSIKCNATTRTTRCPGPNEQGALPTPHHSTQRLLTIQLDREDARRPANFSVVDDLNYAPPVRDVVVFTARITKTAGFSRVFFVVKNGSISFRADNQLFGK